MSLSVNFSNLPQFQVMDVPSHQRSSMAPARPIGPTPTCFFTYCLLSLISVAHWQIMPSEKATDTTKWLWWAGPVVVPGFVCEYYSIRNQSTGTPSLCIPTHYTLAVLVLLNHCGVFAIFIHNDFVTRHAASIQQWKGNGQICAIHFALSFFVLSECEHYRLYWVTHPRPRTLYETTWEKHRAGWWEPLRIIKGALTDPNFTERRDRFAYFDFEHSQTWSQHIIQTFWFLFFHAVVMMALNYGVKRQVNPEHDDSFYSIGVLTRTFFTSKYARWQVLNCLLQRPIRLLNYTLFWAAKDGLERVGKSWQERKARRQAKRDEEVARGFFEAHAARRGLSAF